MQRLRRNRMKRNISMLLVVVFPYTLVLFLYLVFFNHLPQNWTIFEIYGCVILAWLFGLTGAICLAVSNSSKRTDAKAAAKNNMHLDFFVSIFPPCKRIINLYIFLRRLQTSTRMFPYNPVRPPKAAEPFCIFP